MENKVVACLLIALLFPPMQGLVISTLPFRRLRAHKWLSAQSSQNVLDAVQNGVSRLATLQTLLNKYGAPGSIGCSAPHDLVPVVTIPSPELPELITSMDRVADNDNAHVTGELLELHPHLFPIAKSTQRGNYICALRRCYANDASYASSTSSPWPIVEATVGSPGMRLLALQSEHLMRRIACESDFYETQKELVDIYNDGLGTGLLNDRSLDKPYQIGDVAKLGYGVDKYLLLKVGPFPDLYERLATQHLSRGDEASSLIAAESANNKFAGFGSTYRFYARLLASLPKRDEESRDAARMALRLPIPSTGLSAEELKEVAVLAKVADEHDSPPDAIAKLREMYEKIRHHEKEEDQKTNEGKTPEQRAIDEANYLLDTEALTCGKWSEIRPKLAAIYRSVDRNDMANFVSGRY